MLVVHASVDSIGQTQTSNNKQTKVAGDDFAIFWHQETVEAQAIEEMLHFCLDST